MPKNRHKATKRVVLPAALACAAALVWAAIGVPGWAGQPVHGPAAAVPAHGPAAAVEPVACDQKDSPDKGWYRPVYVHRADKESAPGAVEIVRKVMWDVDQVFDASARRLGGESRRLRFVQDARCRIEVMSVAVDGLPARPSFGQARKAAQAAIAAEVRKADPATRQRERRIRNVLFLDTSPRGCGVGPVPSPTHRADLHNGWASVSWGCATQPAVTHELIHQFGVTHCDNRKDQGADPICRGYDKTPRCDELNANQVLDCPKDEFAYFDPRPAPGSPLAEKPSTNVANSPYLIKDQPTPSLKVRMVVSGSGLCLAAADSSMVKRTSCDGAGLTWERTINDQGYFTLSSGGKCLAQAKSPDRNPRLIACAPGDSGQDWWMSPGRGAAAEQYKVVNRATRQALRFTPDAHAEGQLLAMGSQSTATGFVLADTN
ncbi:hypothetical protein AB0M29_13645 [Streptomyces sp. NPDC051976]|uniref:hypothetical protein n=1 Tax=Streptomyces sp. NPDC051976 TaxID=3154947 RepID=UPI0034158E24